MRLLPTASRRRGDGPLGVAPDRTDRPSRCPVSGSAGSGSGTAAGGGRGPSTGRRRPGIADRRRPGPRRAASMHRGQRPTLRLKTGSEARRLAPSTVAAKVSAAWAASWTTSTWIRPPRSRRWIRSRNHFASSRSSSPRRSNASDEPAGRGTAPARDPGRSLARHAAASMWAMVAPRPPRRRSASSRSLSRGHGVRIVGEPESEAVESCASASSVAQGGGHVLPRRSRLCRPRPFLIGRIGRRAHAADRPAVRSPPPVARGRIDRPGGHRRMKAASVACTARSERASLLSAARPSGISRQ